MNINDLSNTQLNYLAAKASDYEKVEEELERYHNGFKGGCYACETVAEKNIELKAENARLEHQLNHMIDVDIHNEFVSENAKLRQALEEIHELTSNGMGLINRLHYIAKAALEVSDE